MQAKQDSRDPSGPLVCPESSRTLKPGFARSPSTEATVFSCAPPMIKRVMTCVMRMARAFRLIHIHSDGSDRAAFCLAHPLEDFLVLGRAFHCILEVKLRVFDSGFGILLFVSNVKKAVIKGGRH